MGAIGLRIFRLTMKRLLGSIPMPVAIVMALGVSMLLTVVVIACFVMTGNAIATVGFAIALHTLAWTTIWLKGAKP
jgi:hypothetical protein